MSSKVTKLKTAGAKGGGRAASADKSGEPEVEPRLQLRMRDVLERVVDRSGMRKGEARTAIEATMAVIGEAIENGEDIDLPGFGKLKLQREKQTPRGKTFILRLVRTDPENAAKAPLAEDEKGG